MKVRDIAAALEEFAPLPLQENYDNAGLIVGAPDDEVSCALLCVDTLASYISVIADKREPLSFLASHGVFTLI